MTHLEFDCSDEKAAVLLQAARLFDEGVKPAEWISTKDRLPEESDGTVLVCFPDVSPYNLREHYRNAKHDQRVRTALHSQYSNTWFIGDMRGVGGTAPTHWMPLPEPPMEERR